MKRTKYPIHPDFQKWANLNPPLHKATLPAMQKLMGLLFARERSTAAVTVERKDIPVDGGILYAERLREFDVPVELHNTEGTMHGFDIVLNSPIVRGCVDRRIAFLKKIFHR